MWCWNDRDHWLQQKQQMALFDPSSPTSHNVDPFISDWELRFFVTIYLTRNKTVAGSYWSLFRLLGWQWCSWCLLDLILCLLIAPGIGGYDVSLIAKQFKLKHRRVELGTLLPRVCRFARSPSILEVAPAVPCCCLAETDDEPGRDLLQPLDAWCCTILINNSHR